MIVAHEHWFDVLSKAATRSTTRRQIAGSAALLLPGLLFASDFGIAADKNRAAKNKKKGSGGKDSKKKSGKKERAKKGNRNQGNGTKTPDHLSPPEPGDDYCDSYLSTVPELAPDCRDILEQCFPPDQFCIYISQTGVDADTYGVACCPSPKVCCSRGCFNLENDRENCGSCGNACAAGELCIGGQCACADPRGCGVCERNCLCPAGRKFCEDTKLCVYEGNVCCGPTDYDGCPTNLPCCGSGDNRYCSAYSDSCSGAAAVAS